MAKDLLRTYERLRQKLPASLDDEIVLSLGDFPTQESRLETGEIAVLEREHHYDGPYTEWRIDCPWMCLTPGASESMGLLLIHVLLSPKALAVDLQLNHPASEIRVIRVATPPQNATGLRVLATEFLYMPTVPRRHPWDADVVAPWDYPSLSIARSDQSDSGRIAGAVLHGFGTAAGMGRMAQLFLDAARPTAAQAEFDLECEGGFRGVSPQSAELKIVLPRSEVWPPQCG